MYYLISNCFYAAIIVSCQFCLLYIPPWTLDFGNPCRNDGIEIHFDFLLRAYRNLNSKSLAIA